MSAHAGQRTAEIGEDPFAFQTPSSNGFDESPSFLYGKMVARTVQWPGACFPGRKISSNVEV